MICFEQLKGASFLLPQSVADNHVKVYKVSTHSEESSFDVHACNMKDKLIQS